MNESFPRKWVEKLFYRLGLMYGEQRMASMIGETPVTDIHDLWETQLAAARVSGAQVTSALQIVALEHPTWPPTVGEFILLCKRNVVEPIHQQLRKLPAPRTSFDPRVREAIAAVELGNRKDPKKWAKDILREADEGTYRYPYGISCAREALGMAATREPGEEG